MTRLVTRFLVALTLFSAAIASAAPQTRAEGAVVGPALLTMSGRITKPNQGEMLMLDETAFAALPQVTIRTETPWTEGMTEFQGVPLAALLELAGAEGDIVHAIALNDYAVDIPVADAADSNVIIARSMNGQRMRVRDFGPLWIIYPLSDNPGYRNEATHSKMIWQLNRIEVR